jgi:hypothetical protein
MNRKYTWEAISGYQKPIEMQHNSSIKKGDPSSEAVSTIIILHPILKTGVMLPDETFRCA